MTRPFFLTLALAIVLAPPMLVIAQSSGPNPCSYLSDREVSAEVKASVTDDIREGYTCRYSNGAGGLAFVTVLADDKNGQSPTATFNSWLRETKNYMPIHGLSNAYTIGTAAIALHHGKLITTNVYNRGSSRNVLRDASIRLLSSVLQESK